MEATTATTILAAEAQRLFDQLVTEPRDLALIKAENTHGGQAVYATMLLAGDVSGSVRCEISVSVARVLARVLGALDVTPEVSSPDCLDATAEFLNIVAGHVSGSLEEQGVRVELFPPTSTLALADSTPAAPFSFFAELR